MITELIAALAVGAAAYAGVIQKQSLGYQAGALMGLSLSWALNVN